MYLKAKNAFPNVCYEWLRAQTLTYKCGNQYVPYDGEYVRNLVILDGGIANATSGIAVEDVTGCDVEVR